MTANSFNWRESWIGGREREVSQSSLEQIFEDNIQVNFVISDAKFQA